MSPPVVAYFDGLTEQGPFGGPRNPGGYGCGGWVVKADARMVVSADITGHAFYGSGEGITNNTSEYRAALDALRAVYRTGYRGPVELRGDSKLVVEQMRGNWGCSVERLRVLRDKLREAATHFECVAWTWLPREDNAEADALSREALAQAHALARQSRQEAVG